MITTHLSESTTSILSIGLELAILIGSLGVVLLRRVMYCALLLGFVFICIALLYLLLNADFLAAAQVLIYVGAVNVLIVFAIMLINNPEEAGTDPHWTVGDTIAAVISTELFALILDMISVTSWDSSTHSSSSFQNEAMTKPLSNSIEVIGSHLLTDLVLPFELLSLLLLVALVGAIMIARKDNAIG